MIHKAPNVVDMCCPTLRAVAWRITRKHAPLESLLLFAKCINTGLLFQIYGDQIDWRIESSPQDLNMVQKNPMEKTNDKRQRSCNIRQKLGAPTRFGYVHGAHAVIAHGLPGKLSRWKTDRKCRLQKHQKSTSVQKKKAEWSVWKKHVAKDSKEWGRF